MTNFAPVSGLVGGALIGLAAIILMLTVGRIAGVSGIVLNAITARDAAGRSWRLAFILGLPVGALLVTAVGLKDWSSTRRVVEKSAEKCLLSSRRESDPGCVKTCWAV